MNIEFYSEIKKILTDARNKVYQTANFAMVEAYWQIGKSIVEAQNGEERAEYGTGLLKELSKQMTQDFGKGFTGANLKNMRQFYLTFPNGYALRSELSWTHYRLLMRVENEHARQFYMDEAVKSQWSTRQLERQINTFFYERLLSSKNKEKVVQEIQTLESKKTPEDIIRDPYVLEFLGLSPNDDFYESDLEQALITHLQKFLLELGRGFSFVARQKRITFDGRHFRIDLVFYNYILKCFVLIDLKIGDLTHQDLGQMQMYVHYYERELMNEGDNPPIGIVLCADKSDAVVRYTLPENETQVFGEKNLDKIIHSHLKASMKNLQTDYVDLYYLHRYNEDIGMEPVAEVMGKLIQEGLIGGWGVSQVVIELLKKAHETTPVSAVQNLYNMMERDCEKEVIPYCVEQGIGVVPFSPVASGFLSGKVTSDTKFEGDDVRKFVPQLQKNNLLANQPVLDILKQYAEEKGATCAQISMAWMLKKYPNVVPIPGSKNKERILENLGAWSIKLTDKEFDGLENALSMVKVYGHRGNEESQQKSFSHNWRTNA